MASMLVSSQEPNCEDKPMQAAQSKMISTEQVNTMSIGLPQSEPALQSLLAIATVLALSEWSASHIIMLHQQSVHCCHSLGCAQTGLDQATSIR